MDQGPNEASNSGFRVERVRQEPRKREVQVVGVEPVGERYLSVIFGGEQLRDFRSPGFDDHVRLIFEGRSGESISRDMTPRRFDARLGRLTLEIADHDGGEVCSWVKAAVPGARATIAGPKGSVIIPGDLPWHLLVGDLTALPAIHRRLEELEAGTRALVYVLADDPAVRRTMDSRARLDVAWCADVKEMMSQLSALDLPSPSGFVWCAGEAELTSQWRKLFRENKAVPPEFTRISGYWKRGAAGSEE